MAKHIHAELMMEYAKDAMENERPWELWECYSADFPVPLTRNPEWNKDTMYRRKVKTFNLNGYEVPEPVRNPLKHEERYYFPNLDCEDLYRHLNWYGGDTDLDLLGRGLIHLTKEAAIAHAKALISFTEK